MNKNKDALKLFIGSGCFLGLVPIFPGSFGALIGLAVHLVAWKSFPSNELVIRTVCLISAIVFSVIHYWLTPWAQKYWNDPDPSHFVLDEIVGYLCVPIFFLFSPASSPVWIIAGFLLFRILDAIKLPGAAYIDRNIHTASGVLFDDVVSAAYTSLFVSGTYYLFQVVG